MNKFDPSVLYFIPLFPIAFIGLWCAVSLILSHVGGWHRLAHRFTVNSPPSGKSHSMQSGRIGGVNYNHCLTIHISEHGLRLSILFLFRLGHPPLLIPWDQIKSVQIVKFLWMQALEIKIEEPPLATLQLPKRLLLDFPAHMVSGGGDAV